MTVHFPVASSVQVVELKVPASLLVQLTVPVGVVFVPASVSLTVAIQLVAWPRTTDDGEQVTVVPVERFAVTVTAVVPELPRCVASPP